MKTDFKHIHFEYRARGSDEKHKKWCCVNNVNGWELGFITFYQEWNMYVFVPEKRVSLFSASCLRDIAEFLDGLNSEQKGEK